MSFNKKNRKLPDELNANFLLGGQFLQFSAVSVVSVSNCSWRAEARLYATGNGIGSIAEIAP
jgi:hypothetical protein